MKNVTETKGLDKLYEDFIIHVKAAGVKTVT
jgi:hypothetical protein